MWLIGFESLVRLSSRMGNTPGACGGCGLTVSETGHYRKKCQEAMLAAGRPCPPNKTSTASKPGTPDWTTSTIPTTISSTIPSTIPSTVSRGRLTTGTRTFKMCKTTKPSHDCENVWWYECSRTFTDWYHLDWCACMLNLLFRCWIHTGNTPITAGTHTDGGAVMR